MGKFQAYTNYADSGLDWLGSLPSGWMTERAKLVFREVNDRSEDGMEQLLSVSEYYGVKPRSEVIEEGEYLSRAESLEGYKKCQVNDLVMNIMLAWKRGLAFSRFSGIVSPAYSVFRLTKPYDPWYLNYLLRTDIYTGLFKRWSTGVIDSRLRLYPDVFGALPIVVPPPSEQSAIAAFLDHETAKIDRLIAKQERLIGLLKEKRQAVISHAVTKGLNPDAPMKDSGVEWLGKVPAHWVVARVKNVFRNLDFRRIPVSAEERSKRTGEYPYYGASGIIDTIDDYLFDEDLVLVGEDGANLVLRSTPLAFVARGKYWVNNHAHILKPIDDLVDYWAEVVELVDVTPLVVGSAQPKLTAEALGNLRIVYAPDYSERLAIQKHLNEQRVKFQTLMDKATKAVALLKEHRTALISAAVTGKIDVRGWQKPNTEPEEAAEAASA